MKKDLVRAAAPWSVGVDPAAITAFLNDVREGNYGLHSLIVMRNGQIAAEGWVDPMKPEYYHQMFSLSKSFTAMAVGFAAQEKRLSPDDTVVSFFPELLSGEPCENMKKMKVRHLLGMCTGHDVEPNRGGDDPVVEFLRSYVAYAPGSHFMYNTPASHMLSAIVQKVTGEKLEDYLKPRLFDPLGFGDYWWECDCKGRSYGGFGLNIQTEDIAKFGLFLLQKGMWEGEQLLDPAWIEECSRYQMHSYSKDSGWPLDWQYGYGWQFWRCLPDGAFRGDGAFGQSCIVLPKQNAVIAITSGAYSAQKTLSAIWKYIVPGLRDDVAADEAALEEMNKAFAAMQIPLPEGEKCDAAAKLAEGRTYALSTNPMGIKSIAFDFGEEVSVTLETENGFSKLPVGYGCWLDGETAAPQATDCSLQTDPLDMPDASCHGINIYRNVSSAGAWKDGAYYLQMIHTRTPHVDVWKFTFDEKGFVAEWRRGFNPASPYHTFFGR